MIIIYKLFHVLIIIKKFVSTALDFQCSLLKAGGFYKLKREYVSEECRQLL